MIKQYKLNKKTYYLIQLSVVDRNGKRHQPKFRIDKKGLRITSHRTAQMLEFEYKKEFIEQLNGSLNSVTFKDWHEHFLEEIRLSYRKSTVMQYNGDLKKWLTKDFCEMKVNDITKSVVHKLVHDTVKENGASPNIQKKVLKCLHRIFESALEEGIIARNPAKGIKVKVPAKEENFLNKKEAELFLSEAKMTDHPFYHLWAMALFTGMRSGEMYALRWTHIDEVAGNIKIVCQWTSKDGVHPTKSNLNRYVPISQELTQLLNELRNLGPSTETLMMADGSYKTFDDLVLPRQKEWKRGEQAKVTRLFCNRIGINQVKFHDLRATFITSLFHHGVPTIQVMKIVGHAELATTERYLRLSAVDIQGATDNLGYNLPQIKADDNVVNLF